MWRCDDRHIDKASAGHTLHDIRPIVPVSEDSCTVSRWIEMIRGLEQVLDGAVILPSSTLHRVVEPGQWDGEKHEPIGAKYSMQFSEGFCIVRDVLHDFRV